MKYLYKATLLLFLLSSSFLSQAQSCQAGFSFLATGNSVDFTDASTATGNITSYSYDFGDGEASSLSNPTHIFPATGSYIVTYTIQTDDACTSTITDTIAVQGGCNISFTVNISPGTGIAVFHSSDTLSNYTYQWNFGDGNSSTTVSPVHQYFAGNYQACLTITDTAGNCSAVFCDSVVITANQSCGNTYAYVDSVGYIDFTVNSPDATEDYLWDFGDGNTGMGDSVFHQFTTSGNYNVCLTTIDSSSFCITDYCTIVSVTIPPVSCATPFTFSDDSTGTITFEVINPNAAHTYTWMFGDATSSVNGDSVVHHYTVPNGYNACLVTQDPGNSCIDTVCQTVLISTCPLSNFSISQTGLTYTLTITNPEPAPAFYTWQWGDGSPIDTGTTVTHTYASPGTYTLGRAITDTVTGCFNAFNAAFSVNYNTSVCDAEFTFSSALNGEVTFTTTNFDSTGVYSWDFGDSSAVYVGENPIYPYSSSGTYVVCATVTDNINNCSDTFCDTVTVSVIPCASEFDYFDVAGNYVFNASNTDASLSFVWDYGDGTIDTAGATFNFHTFPGPGTYLVCLTTADSSGCSNTYCDSVVVPVPSCNSTFTANENNGTVDFTPQPFSLNNTYVYDYGDGTIDTLGFLGLANHSYSMPGSYVVCMTTIDSSISCTSTFCDTVIVTIDCAPTFDWTDNTGDIAFNANPSHPDFVYAWDYGDGSPIDSGASVNHVYAVADTFIVCMTSYNALLNCTNTYCDTVISTVLSCNTSFTIQPNANNPAQFNFVGQPFGFTNTYTYDYGDGTVGQGQFGLGQHTYAAPGTYMVCLTTLFPSGCSATFCDTVTVIFPPACQASFTYSLNNLDAAFQGSLNPGSPSITYSWNFGDGSPAGNGMNTTHSYNMPGNYFVCLTAIDNSNNCMDTVCQSVNITSIEEMNNAVVSNVYPNPFTSDITISYSLIEGGKTMVSLYDVLGNKLQVIKENNQVAGEHKVLLNGADLAAGVYFIRIEAGNKRQVLRVLKQ